MFLHDYFESKGTYLRNIQQQQQQLLYRRSVLWSSSSSSSSGSSRRNESFFSSYVELNPPRKTNVFRYCKRSPPNLISRSWLVMRLIDGMMRILFIGRLWIVRGAWRAACSQCFWTVAAATRYSYAEGRPVRPGLGRTRFTNPSSRNQISSPASFVALTPLSFSAVFQLSSIIIIRRSSHSRSMIKK